MLQKLVSPLGQSINQFRSVLIEEVSSFPLFKENQRTVMFIDERAGG